MINIKIRENRNKILLILLAFLLISGWFYWYELRPAKIRQECSWVKHTTEAIPAKPAMTEEELKAEGLLEDCSPEVAKSSGQVTGRYDKYFDEDKDTCDRKNRQVVYEYKIARPAIAAKDWYSKAKEQDYKFCLHDKGL